MSIEPASVSGPVIRENENVSELRARNGMQGSSTGSKDGQFYSFWDKAVSGAQKLFGMERSLVNDREDDESEANGERGTKIADSQMDRGPYRSVPGFGNQGFGSLSRLLKHESWLPRSNGEAASMTDRTGIIADNSLKDLSPEGTAILKESQATDEPSEENSSTDAFEEEAEDNDPDEAANSAAPLSQLPLTVDLVGAGGMSNKVLTVVDKQVKTSEESVGINSAKHESNMQTLHSGQAVNPLKGVGSADSNIIPATAEGSVESTAVDGSGKSKDNSAHPLTFGSRVSELAKNSKGGGETISEFARSETNKSASESVAKLKEVEKAPATRPDKETLAVDPRKISTDLSAALEKGRSASQAQSIRANQDGLSALSRQMESSDAGPNIPSDKTDPDSAVMKPSVPDSSKSSGQKSPVAIARTQEPARAPGQMYSKAGYENEISNDVTSANRKSETPHFGEGIRDLRAVEGRPTNGRQVGSHVRSQGNTPSVGLVAGLVVNGAQLAAGTEAQSHGNQSENSSKHSSEAVNLRDTGSRSNASISKGESSNGFNLNGALETSAKKAASMPKESVATYSSKNASELKEIYSTMTKSIERLVGSKGDSLSIRINFDQGGSLSLRVSIEGSQISTSMQTDLPGLEGMIKSNWSELANDWGQKGFKMHLPQFASLEGDSGLREDTMNSDSRNNQYRERASSESNPNESRSDRGRRPSSSATNTSESIDSGIVSEEENSIENSQQELKTYA